MKTPVGVFAWIVTTWASGLLGGCIVGPEGESDAATAPADAQPADAATSHDSAAPDDPRRPSSTDARVPDSRTPDAQLADARAPDAQLPDARAPDAQLADAWAPDAQLADAQAPDALAPDALAPDALAPDALAPDAWVRPPPPPPPQPPCLPLDCELGLPAVAAPAGLECEVPPPPVELNPDDPLCRLIEFVGRSGVFGSVEEGGITEYEPCPDGTVMVQPVDGFGARVCDDPTTPEVEWDFTEATEGCRFDANGRTTEVWNGGDSTQLEYDADGHLLHVSSEEGDPIEGKQSETYYVYDEAGRRLSGTRWFSFHNDSGDSGFCNAYNAAGQLTGSLSYSRTNWGGLEFAERCVAPGESDLCPGATLVCERFEDVWALDACPPPP